MNSYPLKNGCTDNWTWTKDRTAPLRIYHVNYINCIALWFARPYRSYAFQGTKVLNCDAHYWEVHVTVNRITAFSPCLYIGVVLGKPLKPDMKLEPLKLNDRRRGRYLIEHKPTVIGVLLDRNQGTLSYYKDGVQEGLAITVPNHLDYELYPAMWDISPFLDIKAIKLGRRLRSFYIDNNLQDRCRAIIMGQISEKADIDLLNLPTAIKEYLCDGYYEQ